jgi:hypothetical protein
MKKYIIKTTTTTTFATMYYKKSLFFLLKKCETCFPPLTCSLFASIVQLDESVIFEQIDLNLSILIGFFPLPF